MGLRDLLADADTLYARALDRYTELSGLGYTDAAKTTAPVYTAMTDDYLDIEGARKLLAAHLIGQTSQSDLQVYNQMERLTASAFEKMARAERLAKTAPGLPKPPPPKVYVGKTGISSWWLWGGAAALLAAGTWFWTSGPRTRKRGGRR